MPVCFANTKTVNDFVVRLKAAGCDVKYDKEAGTVEAKDGDTVVYKGIQKSRVGDWIVSTTDSENIKWK